ILCLTRELVSPTSQRRRTARKHEPCCLASGCWFGESRRVEVFPASRELRPKCRHGRRIHDGPLPANAAGSRSLIRWSAGHRQFRTLPATKKRPSQSTHGNRLAEIFAGSVGLSPRKGSRCYGYLGHPSIALGFAGTHPNSLAPEE